MSLYWPSEMLSDSWKGFPAGVGRGDPRPAFRTRFRGGKWRNQLKKPLTIKNDCEIIDMLGARAGSILIVDCESGQMEAAIEVPIAIEFSSLWPHLKKNWEIIDTVEGLLGWLYIPLKGQQIDVEHSKWKWREILIRLE